MDISFQGFQPGLPNFIYILLFLAAGILSWWSYRHYKTIQPYARYSLMGLRGLVFFILLALLMNPLFQTLTIDYIKPNISVFLDNSQSIGIKKGRYEGEATYREVLNQLKLQERPEVNVSFYAFGEGLNQANPDTLNFDATETNIFAAFEQIDQHSNETDAVILFTDGIYTTGKDPTYLAQTLSTPIYVVGLGDTVSVRDLIVKNVVTSRKGYTRTEHSVETTIINDGFPGQSITVQLLSAGQVISSQTITTSEEKSSHSLNFSIPLREKGLHQYRIRIPELEGEWTEANNEKAFSIDVQSNRDRVLHLAFEVHPDVKTVRSILSTDRNISLTSRTWAGEQQFIEGALPQEPDTLDLMILHGYPQPQVSRKLRNRIEDWADELPVLFIRTPKQDLTSLSSTLKTMLPVSVKSHTSALQSSIYPVQSQTGHTIMELPEVAYANLPSIYAPVQNISSAPAGISLFNIMYQGSKTQVPFVAVQQLGNKRSSLINGYGFYRMRQHYESSTRQFITNLLHNLVTWSAADTEDQLLQVEPSQQVFDSNDRVLLNAFLRNESGQRESDAAVDITLKGDPINEKQFTMNNEGNGKYSLNLGTLAEGIYQFQAVAKKGDRTIDTFEGEFSVAPTRIEYVNTTRNDRFLQQAANQTGGQFYDFTQVDTLWSNIRTSGVLEENREQQISQYYPYRHTIWFIVVVVLLGAEWLLRKYFALP